MYEIKRVDAFKYLGHFIADDLRDRLDIQKEWHWQIDGRCWDFGIRTL